MRTIKSTLLELVPLSVYICYHAVHRSLVFQRLWASNHVKKCTQRVQNLAQYILLCSPNPPPLHFLLVDNVAFWHTQIKRFPHLCSGWMVKFFPMFMRLWSDSKTVQSGFHKVPDKFQQGLSCVCCWNMHGVISTSFFFIVTTRLKSMPTLAVVQQLRNTVPREPIWMSMFLSPTCRFSWRTRIGWTP